MELYSVKIKRWSIVSSTTLIVPDRNAQIYPLSGIHDIIQIFSFEQTTGQGPKLRRVSTVSKMVHWYIHAGFIRQFSQFRDLPLVQGLGRS